jgi:imidazolonepropionase-like amidohydrolase
MTWPRRAALVLVLAGHASASMPQSVHPIVLHAAHLLDVETGRLQTPGEVRVEGERIVAAGTAVEHGPDAEVIDLGGATLMPGLIDAHVHLFLHPGDEDLQTVEESVPKRTLLAMRAARDDLMGGFTAERDMGTEGAGSADTAIRDAIDSGLIVGPRLRISGNAIDILGGHEDANHFNPAQHVLSNADYANNPQELVEVIRQQHKAGSDFVKIYETGHDSMQDGVLHTPYQYTAAELKAGVDEAARWGGRVGVHAMGEPGTLYAANQDRPRPDERPMLEYKIKEFKKQIAAGVRFAVGSDVGPFPHGSQARELELMVKYGMKPLAVLQADLLNGARLLGWEGAIGALKPGYYADIIAVPGSPLEDITVVERVSFVMKGGVVERRGVNP